MENTNFLYKIKELESAAKKLFLEYSIIEAERAGEFIQETINKFKVSKITGHLSIDSEISKKISTDEHEFTFSKEYLSDTAYVFFEQDYYNKNQIFILKEGTLFSELIQECYGMEYFITDEKKSFLISVNWYTIEIVR
ncbi:hypothetical protein [uncultured Chryseobacterium sp.]|uniref:hypothetical protein n=1 Tax=uncultured Chryseobacterium sp. TaxID=259322 RepID=UPI0025E3DE93|nr:hypothetical protein [uncultured Chryseobacterium sp.]